MTGSSTSNASTDRMTYKIDSSRRRLVHSKADSDRAIANALATSSARATAINAATAAVLALPRKHTHGDIENALAAALQDHRAEFHESATAAARRAHQRHFHPLRPAPEHPGLAPRNLPLQDRALVPALPPQALDHPKVREEWIASHEAAHRARYMLRPDILEAWANFDLQTARWEAHQAGRKASGDLRQPVPRDFLKNAKETLQARYTSSLESALSMIETIASGDAEVFQGPSYGGSHHLVRMSEDDLRIDWSLTELENDGLQVVSRKRREEREAATAARSARTPEEREADFDALMEKMLAQPMPQRVEPNLTGLFPLPDNPDELEGNVLEAMVGYIAVAVNMAETQHAKALTKIRTAKRKEAEAADPEGTKAAKATTARMKGNDRIKRHRANETTEQAAERRAKNAAAGRARRAKKAARV